MNASWFLAGLITAVCALAQTPVRPASAAAAGPRVGIYDSRVVAYAHFWSDAETKQRNEKVAAAKALRASGDTEGLAVRLREIAELQQRCHLQVFSTAPATEAMATLQPRLTALQQELGVQRFVSKWDDAALKTIPATSRVDVTDRLVREFKPAAAKLQVIEEIRKKPPLPLDRAKQLVESGRL